MPRCNYKLKNNSGRCRRKCDFNGQKCWQHGGIRGSIREKNYISGPVSITYHPNVMGRDFYIFGDIHHSVKDFCTNAVNESEIGGISITAFFDKIFSESKTLIDFYLEYPLAQKTKIYQASPIPLELTEPPLDSLRRTFEPCMAKGRTNCPNKYKNTRFHNIDIRQPIVKKGYLSFFWNYSDLINEYYKILDKSKNKPNALQQIYTEQIKDDILKKEDFNILTNTYITMVKPKDWIKTIKNKYPTLQSVAEKSVENGLEKAFISTQLIKGSLDGKILEFFIDKKNEIYRSNNRGNYYEQLEKGEILKGLKSLSLLLNRIDGLFVDIYTIGRMFKNTLMDSTEVWMFAGDLHSDSIREFISKYLRYAKFISSNPALKRCQNIEKIKEASYMTANGITPASLK